MRKVETDRLTPQERIELIEHFQDKMIKAIRLTWIHPDPRLQKVLPKIIRDMERQIERYVYNCGYRDDHNIATRVKMRDIEMRMAMARLPLLTPPDPGMLLCQEIVQADAETRESSFLLIANVCIVGVSHLDAHALAGDIRANLRLMDIADIKDQTTKKWLQAIVSLYEILVEKNETHHRNLEENLHNWESEFKTACERLQSERRRISVPAV